MYCSSCGKQIPEESQSCPFCGVPQKSTVSASITPISQTSSTKTYHPENEKFYQKKWFTWVMLIFLWPIGIYLLWQNDFYSQKTNIIISLVVGVVGVVGLFAR